MFQDNKNASKRKYLQEFSVDTSPIMRTNGLIYRKGDPLKYGAICGNCQKRYGPPLPKGDIDIKRCPKCPEFKYIQARSEQTSITPKKVARDKLAYVKKMALKAIQESAR